MGSDGAGTTGQRPIRWRRATIAQSAALCAPYATALDLYDNLDLHDNNALATGGDCGAQLRAERRTPTQCLHDPDAPALHLGDLSGNGETGPLTSLGARVPAVSLAEFLEDPLALFSWDAGAGR